MIGGTDMLVNGGVLVWCFELHNYRTRGEIKDGGTNVVQELQSEWFCATSDEQQVWLYEGRIEN